MQQGTVLGPVLYTLYTANISTMPNSIIYTFADDIASTTKADEVQILQNQARNMAIGEENKS